MNLNITDERAAELARVDELATPAPWEFDGRCRLIAACKCEAFDNLPPDATKEQIHEAWPMVVFVDSTYGDTATGQRVRDALLVEKMRNSLPGLLSDRLTLLAEVERLRGIVAGVRTEAEAGIVSEMGDGYVAAFAGMILRQIEAKEQA